MRDTGNEAGLTLQYVLEIIWMVYPPAATGLDPQKRYLWMKPVAHDDDVDVAFMGMYLGVNGCVPGHLWVCTWHLWIDTSHLRLCNWGFVGS